MDTPYRNQKHSNTDGGGGGGTPTTDVELQGSPVSNFINSLSPIKPVKSAPITQIFTSLNLPSPPSVFTSPHHISKRKSRFLNRHQSPDSSDPKLDLETENNPCCNLKVSAQLSVNLDIGDFIEEALSESPWKQFKTGIELPISPKNPYGSPDGNATSCSASELAGTSKELVPVVCGTSGKESEDNLNDKKMCQGDQELERLSADWDHLMSNSAELLTFCSSTKAETLTGLTQKHLETDASSGTSNMSGYFSDDRSHVPDSVDPSKGHYTAGPFSQHGKSFGLAFVEPTHGNLATSNVDTQLAGSLSEKTENEPVPCFHRGTQRRFLDFEMVGCDGYVESNGSNVSSFLQSYGMVTHIDKQLVPVMPGTDTSRCAMPGIGLHWNAFGTSLKDYKYMKHEAFYARNQQPNVHSTIFSDNSIPAERDSLENSLASTSPEIGMQVTENGSLLAKQACESLTNEECNPKIPKKKRRKVEAAGELEGCKRCTCKKSKCLKLYCECFLAGVYCTEPCSCQNCFNKPIYEDTVLATRKLIESRNPTAFGPKVITDNTPTSARHKSGCNCKRSSCLKKYCECYQGGVGCSINCRCEGCKNVFGRKGGKHAEPEVEPETRENTEMNKSLQKFEIQESGEQLLASAQLVSRPLVQLPSKGRPPRSSSFIIGSSPGLYASDRLGKPEFLQPQPRFVNQLQRAPENEMPKALQDNYSPGSGVKTTSPKRKRVSPPSCDSGSSPARRSRKLILQSIPPFPPLPQN